MTMQRSGFVKAVLGPVLAGLALCASMAVQAAIPVYGYVVKHAYPHDAQAFTEGLFYRDGILYESTGLNGHSSIRKVALESGKVLQKRDIPAQYFGEGIAAVGNVIIGLTWTNQTGLIFDIDTLQ
jgi:glutamine cyclotransferase